jgi:phosphoribosylamine---glycine ligase
MRFLGVGDAADLSALYLKLAAAGHEVKICIANPLCQDTLGGLIERVHDWKAELTWIRTAGHEGCILFENVGSGRGETQDALRREGYNVIGSSAFGARLENERGFAQQVLSDLGFSTAPVFQFDDRSEAIQFIAARPAPYAFKSNGAGAATFVGRHAKGADVSALLACNTPVGESFILMEVIEGVETGVGAYFNGHEFLRPACLDWEHKRFFPGDLGELTGEMGTVVTYSRTETFFARTLALVEPLLRRHGYCGYINLNTIVNDEGVWPLEFTCRFGYPGFAILDPLQLTPWATLFGSMINRDLVRFETVPGFSVGIVVTTPPFPYSREQIDEPKGLPIVFEGTLSSDDEANLHFGEVALQNGTLVTSGASGYTLVVTGTGVTIADARKAANALVRRVSVANARYRCDIGQKLVDGDFAQIERWGLLDPL